MTIFAPRRPRCRFGLNPVFQGFRQPSGGRGIFQRGEDLRPLIDQQDLAPLPESLTGIQNRPQRLLGINLQRQNGDNLSVPIPDQITEEKGRGSPRMEGLQIAHMTAARLQGADINLAAGKIPAQMLPVGRHHDATRRGIEDLDRFVKLVGILDFYEKLDQRSIALPRLHLPPEFGIRRSADCLGESFPDIDRILLHQVVGREEIDGRASFIEPEQQPVLLGFGDQVEIMDRLGQLVPFPAVEIGAGDAVDTGNQKAGQDKNKQQTEAEGETSPDALKPVRLLLFDQSPARIMNHACSPLTDAKCFSLKTSAYRLALRQIRQPTSIVLNFSAS